LSDQLFLAAQSDSKFSFRNVIIRLALFDADANTLKLMFEHSISGCEPLFF